MECEKCRTFPTAEAAWSYVVGDVRKRTREFDEDDSIKNRGKTEIDWDEFKKRLFEEGYAKVVYRQCDCWYDNWEYFRTARQ